MARIRSKRTGQIVEVPDAVVERYQLPKAQVQPVPQEKPGRFLGGLLPFAGGLLGMAGGGVVGNVPGAALGAGAGTFAGGAVENLAEDLLGQQQEQPLEQLQDVGRSAVKTGLGTLALGYLPKLLTFLRPSYLPSKLVEYTTKQTGDISEELLRKTIGGVRTPAERITRGVVNPDLPGKQLLRGLGQRISGVYKSGEPTPSGARYTGESLRKARQALDLVSKPQPGAIRTPEQELTFRLARGVGDVLHQSNPALALFDKLYNISSRIEAVPGNLLKKFWWAVPATAAGRVFYGRR